MIVDTSALVAVLYREPEYEAIRAALYSADGAIPAPVLVEFHRVAALERNQPNAEAARLLELVFQRNARVLPFSEEAAVAAIEANQAYGSGNGHGGTMNMLDLMVYGMAKTTGRPILCTGKDFAATDAELHPASRRW